MTDDRELIPLLLSRMESDILDFKKSQYRIGQVASNEQKSDLIKDIICMANTPRPEPAYIVIGVVAENGGSPGIPVMGPKM